MRFAICNEIFEPWAWERVCQYTHSLGYEGLEVAPFTLAERAGDLSPMKRKEIRDTAERIGMEILGLHWLLVKPPGLYITHPDASIRRKTADYFVDLVGLCADLGGKVMILGSPKQRSLLPGVSRAQAIAYALEVLRPCLDPAAKRGVTLAFEPLSPKETDFINTAEETIELIKAMNHPAMGIKLEWKAM